MTCRQLKTDVMDVALGMALDPARESAVTAHLRSCAACTALVERQRAISMSLRRLAGDHTVPPLDPVRLQRLLAAIDAAPHRPRRSLVAVGVSLAATVAVLVSLTVPGKPAAPQAVRPAAMPPAAHALDTFVVLPGAGALPRFEHGEVIRMEIPSSGGAVQADVLVGQDGLARAVRFVE